MLSGDEKAPLKIPSFLWLPEQQKQNTATEFQLIYESQKQPLNFIRIN
jgi:hypothetical protein